MLLLDYGLNPAILLQLLGEHDRVVYRMMGWVSVWVAGIWDGMEPSIHHLYLYDYVCMYVMK